MTFKNINNQIDANNIRIVGSEDDYTENIDISGEHIKEKIRAIGEILDSNIGVCLSDENDLKIKNIVSSNSELFNK